jgi:hypothetical protein
MMVVSSLSPNHSNASSQKAAVESWQSFGKCFSLNGQEEISQLSGAYSNIQFVPTNKTIGHLVGKNLVTIWAMIEFAISKDEDLLIVNSDIIVQRLPSLKQDGITVFSRYDYTDGTEGAKKFENGFDMFYIPKSILQIFPFSIYAMGLVYWDYFLPFIAYEKNVPTYYPLGEYAHHKIHAIHYSIEEYFDVGRHFQWEFKIDRQLTPSQVAAQSLAKIKNNLTIY